MTMPVMEPDLDAATLKAWARVIDGGPFSSLCWGERIAFDNPECLTLLGALAAWTDRVRLVTTVIVPQLHDSTMLAKSLATGDVLSGGRLTVGLGVGGRDEDYRAVGASTGTQTMRGLADSVAVMKRIWSGEKVTDSVVPVGPPPLQPGGPELLIGRYHSRPRRRQAERALRRRSPGMGGGWQKQTAPGDVILVRHRRRRTGGEGAGTPAPVALYELDPRQRRRRDGAHHRMGRQR
jgi:alkanesulfonate monooxygenase SsuD/methylene tetrahydromethanopterin reductase-like flavin-dependent oxidoreductase (luciferase family)